MAAELSVPTESPSLQPLVAAAAIMGRSESRRRVDLGGILLDRIDLEGALEYLEEFVRSGQPHQVVTVNLDFVSIASRQPAFRSTLNAADLAVADGMPLVWLSRLKGEPLEERVAGVELVSESCRLANQLGSGVFLLGARPGIAEVAAQRLEDMHPGLRIAGAYAPPMGPISDAENRRILDMIHAAQPGFLFVALGAPRQDMWIHEHLADLNVPVAMGVGCVLDLLAGSMKRAPLWMQRAGLEWAFRLGQEPQRLWRRYLLNDLPTLARLALNVPDASGSQASAG